MGRTRGMLVRNRAYLPTFFLEFWQGLILLRYHCPDLNAHRQSCDFLNNFPNKSQNKIMEKRIYIKQNYGETYIYIRLY